VIVKPFETYKWRWLSVQPSEGLLKAPIFLGVLRALQKHQGQSYSSLDLYHELEEVQISTNSNVTLARNPERNLFRNSGQYWRGTGLLEGAPGEIRLTNLGNRLANGEITNDEFASLMIRNTVLPNPLTYSPSEINKWRMANLRIKPLELILNIMNMLGKNHGQKMGYLTPDELVKVVIPLAGNSYDTSKITELVLRYRNDDLDVSSWPDCAPEANDSRLAREFLLFLENFEVCRSMQSNRNSEQAFYLDVNTDLDLDISLGDTFTENPLKIENEINRSINSDLPSLIERTRVRSNTIYRPNQARFRRHVLSAGARTCILTGESTNEVIEAAHIIPVSQGGSDDVTNGFCMRVDIHRLFDGGKIRINRDGDVLLNHKLLNTPSYSTLPSSIDFPSNVNLENITWRARYL